MTVLRSPDSWLDLVGSAATVLGPSRGHVPDIAQYRISRMHLSPASLWLFGAVTDMPAEAESNGSKDGISKFNLALQVAVRHIQHINGTPQLDPRDDSMHNFELALPVHVSLHKTDERVYPDRELVVLEFLGKSPHLNFSVRAEFVHAYGGKHARQRFVESMHLRHQIG